MSGELIKKTGEIKNDTAQISTAVDLERVDEAICPSCLSESRENVSYGNVEHFEYDSKFTGLTRGANILLPAGYDESREYPVLYFLHGIFGNEFSMINDENLHIKEVIGNLIADNIIRDVVVVFPNMYATKDPNLEPGFSPEQLVPYDEFIFDLTGDLIPYVESHYSVKKDRENRGLIGFSMGGRETLFIGTRRSDLFSCIGAISPAPGLIPSKDWAMFHPGQISEDELVIVNKDYMPKFLMICCGTKDGVVGQFPTQYHNVMNNNGVKHLWYEIPEAEHDANAIKSGLYNYLIRWFI